jgi:rRNA processing protein Krr1/Pno1
LGKENKMAKRVISIDGVNSTSLQGMVNTLGRLIGDEVYMRKVIEIESSESVLKALDTVLEIVKQKQVKEPKKVN